MRAGIAVARARVVLVGMRIPPNYGPSYTQKFYSQYGELAREYRLPLVPFFLETIVANPAYMQADGIHPTASAQPRLLDAIWPSLNPLLKR